MASMIDVSLRETASTACGRAIATTRLVIAASSNAPGTIRRHHDRSGSAWRTRDRLAYVTAYLRRRRRNQKYAAIITRGTTSPARAQVHANLTA